MTPATINNDGYEWAKVSVAEAEGSPSIVLNAGSTCAVKIGSALYFQPGAHVDNGKVGQKIVLTINGTDKVELPLVAGTTEGSVTFKPVWYTIKSGDKDGKLTIKAELSSADVKYYLGANSTTPLTVDEDNGTIRLTEKAERTLVAYNPTTEKYEPITKEATANNIFDVKVSNLADFMDDGVVRMYWAYCVKAAEQYGSSETRTTWSAFTAYDDENEYVDWDKKVGKTQAQGWAYFPEDIPDQVIYVLGVPGIQMAYKDEIKPLGGLRNAVDTSRTTGAVWEVEVDRNIDADTFVPLVTFASGWGVDVGTSIAADTEVTTTISGLSFVEGVTIKSVKFEKVAPEVASADVECSAAVNTAKTGIDVTVKCSVPLYPSSGATTTIGKLEIALSTDVTFAVNVCVINP